MTMSTDEGKMQAAIEKEKKQHEGWLCLSIRGGRIQKLKSGKGGIRVAPAYHWGGRKYRG